MPDERCECEATSILVFPCSGSSNVGQIANVAAIEMTYRGQAKMYCLAGIGGHVPGMVDSAAHADYRIAIDGCAVACARKTLEQAGLVADTAVVLTDLGMEKNHDFVWSLEQVEQAIAAAVANLPTPANGAAGCGRLWLRLRLRLWLLRLGARTCPIPKRALAWPGLPVAMTAGAVTAAIWSAGASLCPNVRRPVEVSVIHPWAGQGQRKPNA